MKAIILKLGCEGCRNELLVERDRMTFTVKSVYCSNGGCKFFNQRFEPPTVELKKSSVAAT